MKKLLMLLLLPLATFALAPKAHAQTVGAASFFNNTIYCQNQKSLLSCALWLDPDGTYIVFFNRGGQKIMPQSAAGPFQFEGREGTYTTRIVGKDTQACLKPDTSTPFTYYTEKDGEVFAGAGCYTLPVLDVGTSEIKTLPGGKTYKFWLLAGR
jgi:hypothetical protein